MRNLIFLILMFFQQCEKSGSTENSKVVFEMDFQEIDTSNWVVESETAISWDKLKGDGFMNIDVPKGITIWLKKKLKRDVVIEFEAEVMEENGPNDRLSDLNCFWMATDPETPNDFFARSEWRNGVFWHYYTLKLYYVGLGGHYNTKTRFRKYYGSADPMPEVIKEYTQPENLITANKKSSIKIICQDSLTQYYYNNRLLYELKEEAPYEEGYFGFRTVNNHMRIHSLKVSRP